MRIERREPPNEELKRIIEQIEKHAGPEQMQEWEERFKSVVAKYGDAVEAVVAGMMQYIMLAKGEVNVPDLFSKAVINGIMIAQMDQADQEFGNWMNSVGGDDSQENGVPDDNAD